MRSHFRYGEGNGTPLQYSCLENPMDGGAWWAVVHGVAKGRTQLNDFPFTFHFHALGKEMATHSSVLAWRIPGTAEPSGVPSMGSHRVRHDWSDLAAATLQVSIEPHSQVFSFSISHKISTPYFYCWLLDHITNNITLKFMWKVIGFFFFFFTSQMLKCPRWFTCKKSISLVEIRQTRIIVDLWRLTLNFCGENLSSSLPSNL